MVIIVYFTFSKSCCKLLLSSSVVHSQCKSRVFHFCSCHLINYLSKFATCYHERVDEIMFRHVFSRHNFTISLYIRSYVASPYKKVQNLTAHHKNSTVTFTNKEQAVSYSILCDVLVRLWIFHMYETKYSWLEISSL